MRRVVSPVRRVESLRLRTSKDLNVGTIMGFAVSVGDLFNGTGVTVVITCSGSFNSWCYTGEAGWSVGTIAGETGDGNLRVYHRQQATQVGETSKGPAALTVGPRRQTAVASSVGESCPRFLPLRQGCCSPLRLRGRVILCPSGVGGGDERKARRSREGSAGSIFSTTARYL
ncbi:hypothetical protein Salat_1707400 [Sesamum alatum]|uniref:Uncharacterized protein n=1 Tax=Sesamum alatum TaxID=300844 RepID=A0AAE2CK46_9LAMI|nr:hypothetical protein Salat_1707400 [Sesamum alatum]